MKDVRFPEQEVYKSNGLKGEGRLGPMGARTCAERRMDTTITRKMKNHLRASAKELKKIR